MGTIRNYFEHIILVNLLVVFFQAFNAKLILSTDMLIVYVAIYNTSHKALQ